MARYYLLSLVQKISTFIENEIHQQMKPIIKIKIRVWLGHLATTILFFMLTTMVWAQQDLYKTTEGSILIKGMIGDSNVTAKSAHVLGVIDFEKSAFTIRVEKSTLVTGVEALDNQLRALENDFIEFHGVMDIDHTNAKFRGPMDFDIEGVLGCSDEDKIISGQGKTKYLGAQYSYLMNISFDIDLNKIDYKIDVPGLNNEIHVELIQTVPK